MKIIFLGLLLLFLGLQLSFAEPTDSIPEFKTGQELTLKQLKKLLLGYDFYDQVRTNHQKQEIVQWLFNECVRIHYSEGELKCKNMLGVIYRDQSEYALSIALHEEVLDESKGDTVMAIFSLNNLGVVYRRIDRPRIALDYHHRALDLSNQYKSDLNISRRSICIALNSIGNINLALDNPRQAIAVFEQSLDMEYNNKNDLGVAINLNNIGGAYEYLNELDKAMQYYRESLQVNEKIDSDVGRCICHLSIGNVFFISKNFQEALNHFKLALGYALKTNDKYYLAQVYANQGNVLLELNHFEEALKELTRYNQIAIEINSTQMVTESFHLLSEYYHRVGSDAYALELYKKGTLFADSLNAEQNSRYLDELQTLYEAKKQKQELELLKERSKINKLTNILMISVLIFALFGITILIFIQRRNGRYHQNMLEQKLLRSQMNPHFIFNALASIQNFMYKNESKKAASFLGNFSSLTRSVLKNSTQELIPLSEEIETLKNYIILERMRQNDRFNYVIDLDEALEPDFIQFPPMLLQPFVENAIIHGLKNKEYDGLLSLSFHESKEMLMITIEDNGIGINAALANRENEGHQSMAMTIFEQRRKLMQRKMKKTINFAITDLSTVGDDKTGTRIEIIFPLIELT